MDGVTKQQAEAGLNRWRILQAMFEDRLRAAREGKLDLTGEQIEAAASGLRQAKRRRAMYERALQALVSD